MTYDEFSDKLRLIKADYLRVHGRTLETVAELEAVLAKRLMGKKKTGLKSLKGLLP